MSFPTPATLLSCQPAYSYHCQSALASATHDNQSVDLLTLACGCGTGGLAGAVSRTCTAPIDRLRLLQQVHASRSLLSMRQVRHGGAMRPA